MRCIVSKISFYIGGNDQRIHCRHGRDCRDKNDNHHCSKYSHPDESRSKSLSGVIRERIRCRHGRDCRDQKDARHCSKYSHYHERISCRYGRDCRDKNGSQHCSKYSHPNT